MRTVFVLFIVLLNSAVALGHPGHGATDPSSFIHYVSSPMHAGMAAGSLATLVMCGRLLWTTGRVRSLNRTAE